MTAELQLFEYNWDDGMLEGEKYDFIVHTRNAQLEQPNSI